MRVRPSYLSLAALVAGVASATPALAQDAALLRYHFREGQTFRTVSTTEAATSQTFQGMEQSTKQTMTQETLVEVLSVDAEGVARLRYTTESVRVSMQTPMGLLEYDSSEPDAEAPQALSALALTVGSVLTMSMSPDGSLSDVQGGDELLDRMLDGMSLPPGMTKEGWREDLQAQFGDDAMATSMTQNFSAFPASPVAVGDSWTRATRLAGMPLAMETVTTVTGRSGGVVTLSTESTLSSDDESVMAMAGMEQRYDLTGSSSGTTEIDESTGMYLRMQTETTMNGSVSISVGGQNMTIPMSSRTVTTATTAERAQGG